MSKPFLPFDKLDPPHGPEEATYLRGYHHGAIAAVEALKAGADTREIEYFLSAEVRTWRENHGSAAYPTELPAPGDTS